MIIFHYQYFVVVCQQQDEVQITSKCKNIVLAYVGLVQERDKLILKLAVSSNPELKQNMGKEIDSACSNPESTLS